MKKIAIVAVLLMVFSISASASYISLKTSLTSKVKGNVLEVMVDVVNKGDEPAYNVQAEIKVGEQKFLAEKRAELGINQTYKAYATFNLKLGKPGSYPLVLVMHYADANQYPFSALTSHTYTYKTASPPSEVFGRMKSAKFWKTGKVELTLKNMGEEEIKTKTKLFVPRELTVARTSQQITLAPKSEQRVSFEIENFSALDGSNYQVFAISEYDSQDFHQTSITPGTVKIKETREILGLSYPIVIAILVILVIIFAAAQFWRKK